MCRPADSSDEAAAEAWLVSLGLPTPWEAASQIGKQATSKRHECQSHLRLAVKVILEIQSNGLSGWFCNDWHPDHNDAALSALRAVGASASAQILEAAIRVYGPIQDALNTDNEIPASLMEGADVELNKLEREFWADPDHRVELLAKYMVAHRQHFETLKSD